MSVNDAKAVRDNWFTVNKDLTGLGCNIFSELFRLNDDYTDKFSGIREAGDITTSNVKMREHAVRVMTAFDSWIIALTDTPVLEGLLTRQGEEHVPRKVFKKEFSDMKKAITIVMGNILGAKFNRAAFDKIYDKILGLLLQGQQ